MFNRIFAELAGKAGEPDRIMIDATHLKTHYTAANLLKGGAVPSPIGRTKGGLNSKLHADYDGQGQPIFLLLADGQTSNHKGAFLLLSSLPRAKELLGDNGYDSICFRQALSGPDRARHYAMHPANSQPEGTARLGQATLPPAPQDREPVCPPQGLADRNPLRPMHQPLHVRHNHRRNRLLLVLINEY